MSRFVIDPAFRSQALEQIPDADYVDVLVVPLPPGATHDPVRWVDATFGVGDAPPWVRALFALRQSVVGLVGISRGAGDDFTIRQVLGDEALVHVDEQHLEFAAGLGVDAESGLVRLTTTVRLHNWRGRLYFAPVRALHRPVAGAMLRRAARRLEPSTAAGQRVRRSRNSSRLPNGSAA